MIPGDPLANVLYVDLSRRSYRVERREDLFADDIGGAGAGIRLLDENCPVGADPLGPDNPIVLTVGALTGLFPLASKTVAMFKSPHTGNLGESHGGGRSAVAIRSAGLGAIVITGASSSPVWIAVHGHDVFFRDADTVWGMSSLFTVGRVIRDNEPGAGVRSIMRIGRAGEEMVSYACVTTETYRHFGRLGLGAVFGSKKLKALVVSGAEVIPTADPKAYKRTYKELFAATQSDVMRKYHDLGTAENVTPLNAIGGLPTRNLLSGRMPDTERISGEGLAAHYLGRRLACAHCPVGCIHIAALREPYTDDPYFYKTRMISYDYEPIFSLGTLLGINDPECYLRLMETVEALGLDCMSAGAVLAWATEAMEHGLITENDTDGVHLVWGEDAPYRAMVRGIVDGKNDFYLALRRGVAFAAQQYGGEDFALSFAGHEMAGYHTGPAAHLGFLFGARHSHCDNAGYSLDQTALMSGATVPLEEMARSLVAEERWRQVLSCLVVCFFARGIYKPEQTCAALASAGFDVAPADLDALGRRVYRAKYDFKLREGFDPAAVAYPDRIFATRSAAGLIDRAEFARAVSVMSAEVLAD
jgi:aldehyde:ferredoxin oxidoreductase